MVQGEDNWMKGNIKFTYLFPEKIYTCGWPERDGEREAKKETEQPKSLIKPIKLQYRVSIQPHDQTKSKCHAHAMPKWMPLRKVTQSICLSSTLWNQDQ